MNFDRVIAVRNAKTVYRDGNLCVKVFNQEYSKAEVLNEALNQARIEETGLRIPKVLEVTAVDGKWAIISEYIKGKTLSQLMKEQEDRREEYLELLMTLQLEMHQKDCPPLLNPLKERLHQKLLVSELDATVRYDLHHRLEKMPRANQICHGDFSPANVIIREDGTPYLLDWAHVTQGSAAADAAHTYLILRLNGEAQMAGMYMDRFCEKSGISKDQLRKWFPIIAAARSVKSNYENRNTLLSWVNTTNFEEK